MKINPTYFICLSLLTPAFSQEPDKRIENELRKQVAQEMERMKHPERRGDQWMIGIAGHPVEPMLRKHMNLEEGRGMQVVRVVPESPASQAGLKQDDIVISANKQPIGNLDQLRAQVTASANDKKPLMLEVIQEGKRRTLRINPPAPEKKPEVRKPEVQNPDARRPEIQRPNVRIEEFIHRFEQLQKRINTLEEKLEKLNDKLSQLSEKKEKKDKEQKAEKEEKRDKQD